MEFKRTRAHVANIVAKERGMSKALKMNKKLNYNSKISTEIIDGICEIVYKGLPIASAANAYGLAPNTVHTWLKKGNAELEKLALIVDSGANLDNIEVSLYAQLVYKFRKACSESEQELVKGIKASGDSGVWAAAAWLLERRYPKTWSKQSQSNINVAGTVHSNVTHVIMAPEESKSIEEWNMQQKLLEKKKTEEVIWKEPEKLVEAEYSAITNNKKDD